MEEKKLNTETRKSYLSEEERQKEEEFRRIREYRGNRNRFILLMVRIIGTIGVSITWFLAGDMYRVMHVLDKPVSINYLVAIIFSVIATISIIGASIADYIYTKLR